MTDIHPDERPILEALRRRSDSWWLSPMIVRVEQPPVQGGCPVVVCDASLYEADAPADGEVMGVAVARDDGWQLGCIECRTPVAEPDAGMCPSCRRRAGLDGPVDGR